MLFAWLQRKRAARDAARRLYQSALRQSREPAFYDAYGVADTTDGRYDLAALHAVLIVDRLDAEGPAGRRLGRAMVAAMCRRMEQDLRENGAGDIGVVRHVQKMLKAFNGRCQSYRAALSAPGDEALSIAIARNVYRRQEIPDGARALAAYVRAVQAGLSVLSMAQLERDGASFPPALPDSHRSFAHAQGL